ncbi:ATPase [Humibacillus sp. DSM 29435]|nr:ATPase [Humibacillus sp. DSM 29435]
MPTPAALAKAAPHPPAVVAPPTITTDHSASAAHGRVDEQGVVYVRTADGEEKEVGSYPGATSEQALTYFARKYDELFASAVLLEQRLAQPEVPSKDVQEGLKTLRAQTDDAAVVGDLDALAAKLDEIQSGIAAKRVVEQQHRAEARAAAKVEREAIVAEAESIAGQPESRIQWKTSGARMRELLDDWKAHQRASTRLDRESETALWQRFSTARNGFDKARRTHFAGLDAAHSEAKSAKERLVDEAEKLATSTDWASTAGAFKRLMDEWRQAGRASRSDDDKLWARFKAAQDSFFAAKDALVAQEEEGFRGNLTVKEALLKEAEAILPVTDLEKAKGQLRAVQDKWDAAGKVPRADMERIEKTLRRIEQTVRDADEKRWKSSNPEAAARAQAMVDQLERTVADLEADLTKAEASGNASKVKKATEALEARRAWLDQARAGVAEFGG